MAFPTVDSTLFPPTTSPLTVGFMHSDLFRRQQLAVVGVCVGVVGTVAGRFDAVRGPARR